MEDMGLIKGKVNSAFWNNKKVFLTGHTGFKGSWLSLWLQSMGSIVKGYSLNVNTNPSLFKEAKVDLEMDSEIGDIRDLDKLKSSMSKFNPDILIHMAAQPLVRLSYRNPIETYSTNVMGTANVLEAARSCNNLKSIVSVTSDKCYENKEIQRGYKEHEPMGGHDPYSSSKGCTELVTSAYSRSFYNDDNTAFIASARAGNVIGGGDWSEDRLIPDILRAFQESKPVIIRNPESTRPWQHVLEPLSGYLLLAQSLYIDGKNYNGGWNFGPIDEDCKSVSWILNEMVKIWGGDSKWKLDLDNNPHEANFLKLDCSKAASKLKWLPKWRLRESLELIVDWHKVFISGGNIKRQCLMEINKYLK